MKFSFIITSLGKSQQLQNCIDSIEKAYQYKRGFETEILVVFQNVRENGCNIKTRYRELSTFYYTNQRGLSRARNYGIRRSKGDFLIFLDDDAQIKENFLSVLSKSCLPAGAEAFCGRIFEQNTNNVYGSCFNNDKRKYLGRTDFRYFKGSSHVFKKRIFNEIGLYDERFGAGAKYPGAEESDMFFRLKRRGGKVIYLPELVFYHPIIYGSKVFDYSYAVGAALTKQVFSDNRHLPIYLFIMAGIIFRSFLRIFQNIFFSKSMALKDIRFRYRSIFLGTLKGIFDYLKEIKGKIWNL